MHRVQQHDRIGWLCKRRGGGLIRLDRGQWCAAYLGHDKVSDVGVGRILLQIFHEGIVDIACHRLEFMLPIGEATGIGVDDDTSACERIKFLGRKAFAATGGEPDILRIKGSADNGRFFALHETDGGGNMVALGGR